MFFKKSIIFVALLMLLFAAAPRIRANGEEYKIIVNHLKTKYRAKKVKIPMIFLARFAVRAVRPAGVKSFSVTMFENLQFSRENLNSEMQTMLGEAFSAEWTPIMRFRSREDGGQQAYLYLREAGSSIKIMLVTISKKEAVVIRAAFSPEKLLDFINNPKILGISLDDKK